MKKFLVIRITVVLLLLCCPAVTIVNAQITDVSGWQNAKWNMSEAEIIEAFKPQIIKLSEREIHTKSDGYADYVIPDYEIEGRKFTVFFDMDGKTQKLKRIRISYNEKESLISQDFLFSAYDSLLTRKYGSPTFKKDEKKPKMVTLERQWVFKTTTISLTYVWWGEISWLTIMYFPSEAGDINKI